ncbi:GNAT family N-acetyltransferase [Alicyclobacillus fastidiosus]|uniref:GNAT family N-acetyltransferase n=1 Tax=Alicyclobacillus fastidiosus TaxID=392011 RepID=A0ABV5AIV5_9BACL|nr:GNAT family N-acetyltransferase [Alicyclobacillus fastidiosus]WEH07786.1 GNAT family N-acetyltransferase [Alicyclobacillus fastidiosus]
MKITRTTDFELIAQLNQPIHELHVALYPQYFTEYTFEAIRDAFQELVQNESFVFLLLEDDQEALGYAWIEMKMYPQTAFTKQRTTAFVHQLCVVGHQRRRGYGTAFMNHIYELARTEGMDSVELDYWVENEVARNFYSKEGFLGYREFVHKKV